MKRWTRGLDGSVIAAFALLLVVVIVGWQLVLAERDAAVKDRQIDALIQTAEAKDAAAERRDEAAAEAARAAAANQAALLDYTRALADRQRDIVAYLRDHGIELPVRFVREIPAPDAVVPQRRPKVGVRPPSSRRSSAPTDRRPGKSSQAPGHNKKRVNR